MSSMKTNSRFCKRQRSKCHVIEHKVGWRGWPKAEYDRCVRCGKIFHFHTFDGTEYRYSCLEIRGVNHATK